MSGNVRKHQLEYNCQWHKMYVGIDAKIMQIWAAQLTLNNVSDSQVLGDLLNQIQLDKRIDSAYIDGAYYT